jgi:hypothetical protein
VGPKAVKRDFFLKKNLNFLSPQREKESRRAQLIAVLHKNESSVKPKMHEKAESWESSQLRSASAIPNGAKQRARIPE